MPTTPPTGLVQHLHVLDPLGLAKVSIFGSPYHGLLSSGDELHPPPPEYGDDNHIVSAGHTYRLKVPNLPPIVRTDRQIELDIAAQNALDALDLDNGRVYQWRDQLLFNQRVVYGANHQIGSPGFFVIPTIAVDGSVWKTTISPSGVDGLSNPLLTGVGSNDFEWVITCEKHFEIRDDNRPAVPSYQTTVEHTEPDTIDTRGGHAKAFIVCDINSKGDELLLAVRIKLGEDDYPAGFHLDGYVPAGLIDLSVMKIYKLKITINPDPEVTPHLSADLTLLYDLDDGIGSLSNSAEGAPEQVEWAIGLTSQIVTEDDTDPPVFVTTVETHIGVMVEDSLSGVALINEEFAYAHSGSVSREFSWTDAVRWAWFADNDTVVPVYVDMVADASFSQDPAPTVASHHVSTCTTTNDISEGGAGITYDGTLVLPSLTVESGMTDALSWTYRVRAGGHEVEKTASMNIHYAVAQTAEFQDDCGTGVPLLSDAFRTATETTTFTFDGIGRYSQAFDIQAYLDANPGAGSPHNITNGQFFHDKELGSPPNDDWLGPNFGLRVNSVYPEVGAALEAFGDILLATNKAVPVFSYYKVNTITGKSAVLYVGGLAGEEDAANTESVAYNPVTGELARDLGGPHTWF